MIQLLLAHIDKNLNNQNTYIFSHWNMESSSHITNTSQIELNCKRCNMNENFLPVNCYWLTSQLSFCYKIDI